MSQGAGTCFIHIGAPKTGSTTLQKFCSDNRRVLYQQGILYPDISLRGYGHHDLAFLLSGGYPEWATSQDRSLADLAKELIRAAKDCDRALLLSSENFYLYPEPEKLFDFLNQCAVTPKFRVVIIVYIRRQDEAHESWYNQTIKAQGYTHTFDESIKAFSTLWDYALNLDRWAKIFGAENIVVRPYERDQMIDGNVVADFLNVIGLSSTDFTVPSEQVNTGINRDLLEFQRSLNKLPLSPQEKRRFHKELMELSAEMAGTGFFDELSLLTRDQRMAVVDDYAESNADVARRYFNRSNLFNEEPPDTGPGPGDRKELSADKLAAIVGWLLVKTKNTD